MATCEICNEKRFAQEEFCLHCLNLIEDIDFEIFNEERKWLEELFIARFNNFLVVFSLIVTAGFANSFENGRCLVFYFGAALLSLCWVTLIRAYYKYDNMVKILLGQKSFKGKPNQIKIVQDLLERRKTFRFRKFVISRWLTYYIPIICISFLIIIGLCISLCIIK